MTTYFETMILPLVKLSEQDFYNIEDAAIILDIPVKEVIKFGSNYDNQKGRVRLKIEDGKISYDTFVKFFSGADKPEA